MERKFDAVKMNAFGVHDRCVWAYADARNGSWFGTAPIFVNTLNGQTLPIDVEYTDTIRTLKSKIQVKDEQHTPPEQQRLIFAQEYLDDSRQLFEYNILSKSTLLMILPLCGGMWMKQSGRDDYGVQQPPLLAPRDSKQPPAATSEATDNDGATNTVAEQKKKNH